MKLCHPLRSVKKRVCLFRHYKKKSFHTDENCVPETTCCSFNRPVSQLWLTSDCNYVASLKWREREKNKRNRERDQVRSVFLFFFSFTSESQGGHGRKRGAGNHRCRNFLDDLKETGEIGQKTQNRWVNIEARAAFPFHHLLPPFLPPPASLSATHVHK